MWITLNSSDIQKCLVLVFAEIQLESNNSTTSAIINSILVA